MASEKKPIKRKATKSSTAATSSTKSKSSKEAVAQGSSFGGRGGTSSAPNKNGASKRSSSTKKVPAKKRSLASRLLTALIVAVLIVVVIIGGLFSWDRWFRFDDAADIQGTWRVEALPAGAGDASKAQDAAVSIDGEYIHLNDEVAYAYTLNATDKTIEFSFGQFAGGGVYRFSPERSELFITEEAQSDPVGDFVRAFKTFVGEDQGNSGADERSIVLTKASSTPDASISGLPKE